MDFLDYIGNGFAVLLLSLPVLYFILIPLLIWKTFRMEAKPTIESVSPEDLPNIVRDSFANTFEELSEVGFEHEGAYFLPHAVSNVKSLLALFVNHQDKTCAMGAVMYAEVGTEWQIQANYTEFATEFEDGGEVSTGNQHAPGSFPNNEKKVATIHPTIKNVARLYEAHKAMVRKHSSNRRPVINAIQKFGGDYGAAVAAGMRQEFDHATSCGYLKIWGEESERGQSSVNSPYAPPAESSQGTSFVATLKGAFLMTWRELWPIKPIVVNRRLARDKRRLQEAGFDIS